MNIGIVLLIVALVLFTLAAFGVNSGRFSLVAGGLAFCVLSALSPALF